MPAAVVASLAKRAGVTTDKAEKAWDKIKTSVVGQKLKSGKVINKNENSWGDEEWAYATGALKGALGTDNKESKMNTVALIHRVAEGESPAKVLDELAGKQLRLPGAATVTASFLYSGVGDFWVGNGRRWDDDAGCVFASYGPGTTCGEIVDQWVDDFNSGGDFVGKDAFNEVSDAELRSELQGLFRNWETDKDKPFDDTLDSDEFEEDGEWSQAIALVELDASDDEDSE